MTLFIKSPWWGAWKTFGWAKDTWGVGIDSDVVNALADKKATVELEIYNFKGKYLIPAKTVKDYSVKNKCLFMAKGKFLYVVPKTMLTLAL